MNETILPTDHRNAGQIVDDELNRALVNPVPPGVRLHAIIDACHSGTALDLPYRCQHNYGMVQWQQEYDPRRLRSWKARFFHLATLWCLFHSTQWWLFCCTG